MFECFLEVHEGWEEPRDRISAVQDAENCAAMLGPVVAVLTSVCLWRFHQSCYGAFRLPLWGDECRSAIPKVAILRGGLSLELLVHDDGKALRPPAMPMGKLDDARSRAEPAKAWPGLCTARTSVLMSN
jgi:hypothetical protein